MKRRLLAVFVLLFVVWLPGSVSAGFPVIISTTFTYQGYLTNASGSVNAQCDFQFGLFATSNGAAQIGSTLTRTQIPVTNGVFNVGLDFGGAAFDGTQRFLQIAVRCPAGSGVYTTLTPLQEITPAPFAMFATDSTWSGLSGVPGGFADGTDNDTLATLACSSGQIPKWGGAGWTCAADWSLSGNSGTTPGTNFIGTTDNQPLEFRVNNLRVLRLEPNATSPNIIGGFNGNTILTGVVGGFIGGGGDTGDLNIVTDNYGFVGGGRFNRAGDNAGAVDDALNATVGGGQSNFASGGWSFIGGGTSNEATATFSTVSGGGFNTASGSEATIGGGGGNTASGNFSTIPGGQNNTAGGQYSFAAGDQAQALQDGTFVWADSSGTVFHSNLPNQFFVRASGGTIFYSSSNLSTGVALDAGSGSWSSVSDRNVKSNFVVVDPQAILQSVVNLPISTWNYNAENPAIRHIGPMAQDFYASFGVGEDNTHISTIDSEGVALAAIQGLYQQVQAKDAEISDLQTKNADLQAKLDDLDARVTALENGKSAPASSGGLQPWMLVGGLVIGGVWIGQRKNRGEKHI